MTELLTSCDISQNIGLLSFFRDTCGVNDQYEYKSPGPDAYSLTVYQDCCDVRKQNLLEVFKEFCKFGVVNSSTNSTFICLIPKKKEPSKLSEFRPIS